MVFGLRCVLRWGNGKFSPGPIKGREMTEPTDDTPPEARVADVSDKLADKPKLPKRGLSPTLMTAAATGIGSAALLAALLYANRSRKKRSDPE